MVGDHVWQRAGALDVRQPGLPFTGVALRGEGERRTYDLRAGRDAPDLPVRGVPHLEVLGAVHSAGPEHGDVRLVVDVVGELQAGGLQRAHRGIDEADPVRAVAVVARIRRIRGLTAVVAVDVAEDHLVLRVVRRLRESLSLRDYLVCRLLLEKK